MALRIAATKSLRASTTASVSRRAFSSLDRMQTKENYEAVLQKFAEIRACAVLRTPTSEACPKAMQAAIDGGFKICEFTLTTPDCLDHLADFRQKYDGDVMVGCGTILNTEDAEKAIDAGSEFIITPVMLPDVIEWCAARNIVCVPGCQTPTELVNAYRHGAPLQKLFPGVAGTLLLNFKSVNLCLPPGPITLLFLAQARESRHPGRGTQHVTRITETLAFCQIFSLPLSFSSNVERW